MEIPIVNYQKTNIESLLKLTERLFKLGFFASYLTSQQLIVLENLLSIENESSKVHVWRELMKGNVIMEVVEVTCSADTNGFEEPSSGDSTGEVNNSNDNNLEGDDEPEEEKKAEEDMDDFSQLDLEDFKQQTIGKDFIGNLSLKLRYVIWQCALDYLYKDETADLQTSDNDDPFSYVLLEEDVEPTEPENRDSGKEDAKIANDDDDDNYDYDEEEDEKDAQRAYDKDSNSNSNSSGIEIVDDGKDDHLTVRLRITKEVLVKLRNDNHEKILKNSNKIYHSFEYDRENMLKRLRLEENDKLIDGNDKKRKRSSSIDTVNVFESAEASEDKIEEVDASQESSQGLDGKRPKHDPMNLPVNLGAANLSLKHLLASIQENKQKLKLSDYELKHLIVDVRKNRSKWASDEKIGQEELYEACEKVVLELRNYTEHSTPFLNKVSKREAPNYHLIIKKSMDLNTVLKKLKTFQYDSKQAFVDDITLIWRNCLTYNSDPSHFLRGHAIAMQKKSLQLLPLIPDIVIRNRADVEKELEEMDKDRECEDVDEEVAGSGRKGLNMGAHKPAKADGNVSIAQNTEEAPEEYVQADGNGQEPSKEEQTQVRNTSQDQKSNEDAVEQKASETEESKADKQLPSAQEVTEEDDDEDDELAESQSFVLEKDDDRDDAEISVWKSLTAKVRAEICLRRSLCFEHGKLNRNSKALIKDPRRLKTFEQLYAEYEEQKEFETQREKLERESIMKNGFQTMVKQEEEDNTSFSTEHAAESSDPFQKESDEMEIDSTIFLKEYDSVNCFPATVYAGVDSKLLDREEDACVRRILDEGNNKPSAFLVNRDKGMTPKMNKNIELIQQIRHICHKISLIRLLQSSSSSQSTRTNPNQLIGSHQYKYEAIDDSMDIDPVSRLQTHDYKSNRQLIWRFMQKNVSKITMSNGFETAQPTAINALTELAGDYLSNLIKTVKIHHESNSLSRADSSEILRMSLLENGISRPDDLFIYFESEFSKKTRKLLDIKSKLESFLKELLRPTLQELSERNFEDESQSFMTGDFATEITGEDFFGFKELGLEKEFGVLTSSVPLQLLTFQLQANDAETKEQPKKLQPEEFGNVVYSRITKEELMKQSRWATLLPLIDKAFQRSKAYRQKVAKSNAAADMLIHESLEPIESPWLLEDEEMTFKAKTGRPRLPPTGKISSAYKKKPIADAFILPSEDDETENSEDVKQKIDKGAFDGASLLSPTTLQV
ncbi:hypothetical protein HG537_0C04240 [Torulaspora globosa]|uniref:SAGA complex subunit Spt7 n=1 Tax=Torulaspora globosa TaxID=48254 RepID=A0A7H9HTP3_9SACH|nr:hypothetical protein HG537_0C04240 [Torulaspora sp. CBS 2947]